MMRSIAFCLRKVFHFINCMRLNEKWEQNQVDYIPQIQFAPRCQRSCSTWGRSEPCAIHSAAYRRQNHTLRQAMVIQRQQQRQEWRQIEDRVWQRNISAAKLILYKGNLHPSNYLNTKYQVICWLFVPGHCMVYGLQIDPRLMAPAHDDDDE